MKIHIRTMCGFFFLLCMMLTANVFAADNISVLKIDTLVMEKGVENYSLTVKAFVKNHGPSDEITINVVAVDLNGYELQNSTLTGPVDQGKTRVLVGVVKVPKTVYDEIVRWEWKK
ncbi:MAG: hypothetical protein PF482_03785 [Desulfobacteraceae bacterium]|nr:hypothetical protein [Desulfobacteraceae bacterium]